MADPILFEELAEAPPEDISGLGEIVLLGGGVVDIADLIYGIGEVTLQQANVGAAVADVDLIIGLAEIPLTGSYSFVMPVEECDGFGAIELAGAATTEEQIALGLGEVEVFGLAEGGVGLVAPGDSPFEEIDDALLVLSSLQAQETLALVDRVAYAENITVGANRRAAVADGLRLDASLRIAFEAVTNDELAMAELVAGDPLRTIAAVDALVLSGAASSSINAMAVLADAIALRDALVSVQDGDAEDVAEMASALEILVQAMASVVSGAVFADGAEGLAMASVLVPEVFELGSDPQAIALRLASIEDGLDFAVSFTFDGEPYFATSMNAASRGVTEYTNFDFNSVASFGGTLYGAGDAGLYRHGGDTDAGVPITAYLRTAMQRLAQGQVPGVSDAYLGFRGNGQLQLKVVVRAPRGGEQKGYVFDLIQSPAGAPLPGRFKIGKGLQSVYMAFELGNVAGSDFAIDVMEIRPLVSYRRLP